MNEPTNELTRKQRKELKKQHKQEEREQQQRTSRSKSLTLWALVGIVVVGVVGGLILVAGGDSESTSTDEGIVLAETITDSDWMRGNPDAEITIVEYSDFQCPACRSFMPVVDDLLEKHGDDVRLVYRHFPLRSIHANADLAARATESAGNQDAFWEMHDLLFEKQSSWSNSNDADDVFAQYAEDLGLDVEQFRTDLKSDDVRTRVNNDYQGGVQSDVTSTPSFFVNGELVQMQAFSDLETRVEELLADNS